MLFARYVLYVNKCILLKFVLHAVHEKQGSARWILARSIGIRYWNSSFIHVYSLSNFLL